MPTPVEATIAEPTVSESPIERMIEAARKARTGARATRMHAAERPSTIDMPAATMAREPATVTGKATAGHPATARMATTMPAAALRPHGYSQHKRERRDRNQATHTRIL